MVDGVEDRGHGRIAPCLRAPAIARTGNHWGTRQDALIPVITRRSRVECPVILNRRAGGRRWRAPQDAAICFVVVGVQKSIRAALSTVASLPPVDRKNAAGHFDNPPPSPRSSMQIPHRADRAVTPVTCAGGARRWRRHQNRLLRTAALPRPLRSSSPRTGGAVHCHAAPPRRADDCRRQSQRAGRSNRPGPARVLQHHPPPRTDSAMNGGLIPAGYCSTAPERQCGLFAGEQRDRPS